MSVSIHDTPPDLFSESRPHLGDARGLDVLGQLEGRLLDTPLALQVLALEAPVTRHGHRVTRRLQVDQQPRVLDVRKLC